MATIVGIAGSLRRSSYNAALLRAAATLAPPELTIEIASIRDIPLYDGDLEAADRMPEVVASLKDRIAQADGLLLVTPEYNSSLPGVFKNAIDWLSRPAGDIPRVFGKKPVALMGATTGRGGTALAQAAWLPVLRYLGTQPWFGPRLSVAAAKSVFDANGNLVDREITRLVRTYMAGFAEFLNRAG